VMNWKVSERKRSQSNRCAISTFVWLG